MTVHIYLRRSKNDEGKQQFSLDVQRAGSREFVERLGLLTRGLVEHVDDGKSGDDFHSRAGLRRLLETVKTGDVIVCRDQSRLGRDAIEVTLVIRDLVRDRECRLYYYTTGQQVQFANAIDQATTFIQGTGHQMELEAIRSRTKEALRERVRAGRIAGGRCYGYRQERHTDDFGRSFTTATIDPEQAKVLRRIFAAYAQHYGLKRIAHDLNRDGVPAPMAGRRGKGTWSPGAVRVMLLNPRYRGFYCHGKSKKVRRGGVLVSVKTDPNEVLVVEIPDWRIIDEETWLAVQARFTTRGPNERCARPMAKYALTGIARCGTCGGTIGCSRTSHGKISLKSYACTTHHQRGGRACPVTVHQPMDEVEGALIDYLQEHVLTPEVFADGLARIRREVEARLGQKTVDLAAIDEELRTMRAEQKRLARAVAIADDVPELVTELQQRGARLRQLEAEAADARRTPDEISAQMAKVEADVAARLKDLRAALTQPEELRRVLLTLLPDGLRLYPDRVGRRNVWRLEATATVGLCSPDQMVTPAGIEPAFSA